MTNDLESQEEYPESNTYSSLGNKIQSDPDASAQSQSNPSDGGSTEIDEKPRLNMVYTLFWTFLFQTLGTMAMFWMDLIPGFGLQTNIKLFLPQ